MAGRGQHPGPLQPGLHGRWARAAPAVRSAGGWPGARAALLLGCRSCPLRPSFLSLPLPSPACSILCKKRHVLLSGRAVLEQRLHLRRALDRWGPPSGAAPRALIRADVKWVWAPREGPGEDGEGARCAAGRLRPERAPSPRAADQRLPRARRAGAWSGGAARPGTRAPPPLGAGRGRRGGPAGRSACGNFRVAVGCWVGGAQRARAAFGGAFVPVRWRVGSRFVPAGQSAWEPQRATGVSASVFIEPAPGFGYSPGRAPRELPCCFENRPRTACVHGNRITARQAARLPESGCGWGPRSVRGGGVGRGDLATGSTPRARASAPPCSRGAGYGGGKGSASRR